MSSLTCSPNPTVVTLINNNLIRQNGGSTWSLGSTKLFDVSDLVRLHHFQNYTCNTIGGVLVQQVYQAEVIKIAVNVTSHFKPHGDMVADLLQHIQLMHAVLTMSAMHTRYLEGTSRGPSRFKIYHWQQTLAEFGRRIAPRIGKNDADAMLVTATLINGISFAMVEATDPRESWPFSPAGNSLQWLSLQGGISLNFEATQPLSDESALKLLFAELDEAHPQMDHGPGMSELAPLLLELCDIGARSTAENNAYLRALQVLAPLLQLECNAETVITHLSFIGSMQPEYVALLRSKDHRALLIFSYWYATIYSFQCWWTAPRSRMGCTSICMYLEEHGDESIRELLPFPARACGYTLKEQWSLSTEETPQILMPCTPM